MGAVISSSEKSGMAEGQPLVIGEVLFDHLPNDQLILGGAPFNVAWNLQLMGQNPLFVSAVGQDPLGNEIRDAMAKNSMATVGLQTNNKTTGIVAVSFVDGEPEYEIVADQAYDHLQYRPELVSNREISLLYHGSLAWRGTTTRKAILDFRQNCDVPIFVDLNIRDPWFEMAWLPELLGGVDSLKLNVGELSAISGIPLVDQREQPESKDSRMTQIHRAANEVLQRFPLARLWITDGAIGAYTIGRAGECLFEPSVEVEDFADTIGAGDAFSAAVLNGCLRGMGNQEILKQATLFAAKVCSLEGAIQVDVGDVS